MGFTPRVNFSQPPGWGPNYVVTPKHPEPPVKFNNKINSDFYKQYYASMNSSSALLLLLFLTLNRALDEDYLVPTSEYTSFHRAQAISAPPSWEAVPLTTVDVSEENVAELHCLALGEPTPLVQWSLNAVPLHELVQNERRLLLDGGRVLRIHDLNHDVDSGLYQCNASNFLGHIAAATYLNVQASAPRFKMPDQRVWKVIRDSSVDLNCDVVAAPRPVVRWVDANDSLIAVVPGKIELFPNNHTLRIYEVNNADEGYYYCNVSNKYGINRALNKLEVYKPTYFSEVPAPRKIVVDALDDVELQCKAVPDPRLNLRYLWTHNGKPIQGTTFVDDEGISHLKLPSVRGVELLVRDVPESPIILQIECTHLAHQQALLQWRSPEGINPTGESITHYSVETTTSFQRVESGLQPPKWSVVHEERELSQKNVYKLIVPLSPWVNYTFRIVAHNFYGASEAAVSTPNVCSTPPDVPHKSPEGVQVFGTEPDNLVIRWIPMDKLDWNAPGLKYLIRYRKSSGKSRMEEPQWNEFFVEDPMVNETIIRDQPTFEAYEVQVRAVNSKGYSALPPPTAKGFSGEDFPQTAPKNLKLAGFHNYSAVWLSWDAVPPGSVRGHFNGYKLVYWLTEQPYFSNYLMVENSSTKAGIDGLEAVHNYTVKAHVVNGQYVSEPSNLLHFQTPEGAPSKVHDLRARAVGANSIFVTWQPPLHTNGHSTNGFVEETYVLYRQLYYLHEFLVPDSPYKLAVWAETNGGEGPKVVKPIRTWPIRDPDPPCLLYSLQAQLAYMWNGNQWLT
uniref:Contactin n=1 Tax=Ditylenchus dipsaci TaxID=166011 RepID=A0A915CMW2_9BILA